MPRLASPSPATPLTPNATGIGVAHLFLAMAFLSACADQGAERYAMAKAKNQALVLTLEHPTSRKYDEVLALLDQVPPGSKHFGEARRLRDGLLGARGGLRAPLAKVPNVDGGLGPSVVAQLQLCNRLAEQLSRDGGLTAAGLASLETCRGQAERLDAKGACHDEASPGPATAEPGKPAPHAGD
jgi:hypothetical protein